MSRLARVAAVIAAVMALAASTAHAGDLDSLVAAHTYPIAFENGELSGPGADWLLAEGAKAHFFMLGEQHATADIAELATALYRGLDARGYSRAAIEVGPWSAVEAEKLLRAGPRDFEDYITTGDRSFTFPFFFFTEEVAFGRAVVSLAGDEPDALWGLDQEFVAAGRLLLERLGDLAETPQEKEAVAAAKAETEKNVMLLGSGPEAPWRALYDAFAGSHSTEAREILDGIEISRRIYAPFTGRGGSVYLANDERERYMKTNLLDHIARVERRGGGTPRVFLKFGANHLACGHSPTNVLTLGTFVHELAVYGRVEAFNLHVDCNGGSARDPRSGEAVPCESYFLDTDAPFRRYLRDDAITLIDLRALRPHAKLWKDLDEKTRKLILAYDAYLAIPNVKPATPVTP